MMKWSNNVGIGTDIESIERFEKLDYVHNSSFLNRIFTKNELEYCFSKGRAAPHLAARYAGKESIAKALTSMGKTHVSYKAIEILNNENGVPTVRINNLGFRNLLAYVSLSHCKDKAIAFAVLIDVNHKEMGNSGHQT